VCGQRTGQIARTATHVDDGQCPVSCRGQATEKGESGAGKQLRFGPGHERPAIDQQFEPEEHAVPRTLRLFHVGASRGNFRFIESKISGCAHARSVFLILPVVVFGKSGTKATSFGTMKLSSRLWHSR